MAIRFQVVFLRLQRGAGEGASFARGACVATGAGVRLLPLRLWHGVWLVSGFFLAVAGRGFLSSRCVLVWIVGRFFGNLQYVNV